jgi:hypothetical protein
MNKLYLGDESRSKILDLDETTRPKQKRVRNERVHPQAFCKTVKAKYAPTRFKLDTVHFVHFGDISSTFQTNLYHGSVRHDCIGLWRPGEGCWYYFAPNENKRDMNAARSCLVLQCACYYRKNFCHYRPPYLAHTITNGHLETIVKWAKSF